MINMKPGDVIVFKVAAPDGQPLAFLAGISYTTATSVKAEHKDTITITAIHPGTNAVVIMSSGEHGVVARALDILVSDTPAAPPDLLLFQS